MRITATQVAEACGFSQSTVSQVLNGKVHLYRPETCDKIIETAHRLGYRPNALARATRKGRSGAIAMLEPTEGRLSIGADVHWGIKEELAKRELLLVSAHVNPEQLSDETYLPRVLREFHADGLIVGYAYGFPKRFVELIERHQLPTVWINARGNTDVVRPDDEGAGRMAAEFLLRHEHQRILFADHSAEDAGSQELHYHVEARRRGYLAAVRAAKCTHNLQGPFSDWRHSSRMVEVLSGNARPTAVIANGMQVASLVCLTAAQLGLEIPRDLSLIVVGENTSADYFCRPLTLVLNPSFELGPAAVEMLLQRIENPKRRFAPQEVPFQILDRGTVGPAPAN